ncbi:hypothetical protein GCM10022267_38790 [Lentzea roselyniae]|uniref:Uncharacterized protein n=1 Tax=Lentzea roselyniae TaxID=531940 RepID=A0ABP7B5Y9_9PSEU
MRTRNGRMSPLACAGLVLSSPYASAAAEADRKLRREGSLDTVPDRRDATLTVASVVRRRRVRHPGITGVQSG